MKINFSQVYDNLKRSAFENLPAILTGIGIAGMISAGITAVIVTPEAHERLENIKKDTVGNTKARVKGVVTKVVPLYLPSVGITVASSVALIGATHENNQRNAALAAAYTISENAAREYRDKVIETIGENKERKIRDEVAKDQLEKNPVASNTVVMTGNGSTLFYEPESRTYFESDIETIRRGYNDFNDAYIAEDMLSFNDYLYYLGITPMHNDRNRRLDGDCVGYNRGKSGHPRLINYDPTYGPAKDGRPCVILNVPTPHLYYDMYGKDDEE